MKFEDLEVGMFVESKVTKIRYLVFAKFKESAIFMDVNGIAKNIFKNSCECENYKVSQPYKNKYKSILKDLNRCIENLYNLYFFNKTKSYDIPNTIKLEEVFRDGNIITFYNGDTAIAYKNYLLSPDKYELRRSDYNEDLNNKYKYDLGIKSVTDNYNKKIYERRITVGSKLLISNVEYTVIQIVKIDNKYNYVVMSDNGVISIVDNKFLESTDYSVCSYSVSDKDIDKVLYNLYKVINDREF